MFLRCLLVLFALATPQAPWDGALHGELVDYEDEETGFSFRYPEYWVTVLDVDTMLEVQDGSIDLIREEELTEKERDAYRVMVHVDGSPPYLSNAVVLAYPHRPDGIAAYETSETATQALKDDFERNRASGTYFLQEIYLGESRAFVYRRNVEVDQWKDSIRITYYLTASRTHAYMLVETVLESALDEVRLDQFNQVIQSFRVAVNESGMMDPGLDWGAFKPGEEPDGREPGSDVGRVEAREDFLSNAFGWPVGDDARLHDGCYELDSRGAYPFTVTNTGLGQIEFDFSYEGEAEFLDGDDSAGYGLVFGYRDPDNYFAFLITRGGGFLVVEEKNGAVRELIPWTSSPPLEGERHTLTVQGDYQTVPDEGVAHRYELVFYVDDKEVARTVTPDVLAVSGWFGLFVSAELHIAFDSLASRNYLLDSVMTLDRVQY